MFNFFSITNLYYSSYYLSSNLLTLKHFFEGNHKLCSFLIGAKLPLLILGSNKLLSDKNSILLKCLKLFKTILSNYDKPINSLHILEPHLGINGLRNLKKVSNVTVQDFKFVSGVFFFNFQVNLGTPVLNYHCERVLKSRDPNLVPRTIIPF